MDSEATIDLSQIENFQKALAQSPQAFLPFAYDGMTLSVRVIQGSMAEYPPSTEANQPGRFSLKTGRPMGYYERGRGYWYPIMTKKTLEAAAGGKFGKGRGVVKASALQRSVSRVQGYKLEAGGTSEQLGKSWTSEVQRIGDGLEGSVGTNTSYAEPVQGDKQSTILARYGWDEHSMSAVMDALEPQLDEIWNNAADEFVKALAQ